ncbi:MAG TPA: DinB family protein [Acetobacteraceae bacterium]|jgi:uncharacterized damage-inducible protein DinB|nr:DinB family protein [Acetobacteraceae bacterium]
MWKPHYEQFAAYNRWANRRLYDEAAGLPDDARKRDLGLFFKSLHGTLNHLLVADRVWLRRLTGEGPEPARLNEILFEDFGALRDARQSEDARIIRFIGSLAEDDFAATFEYRTLAGKAYTQRRCATLAHFFNHQTHHRGQAHAALTILGVPEPAPLDLLAMQRA